MIRKLVALLVLAASSGSAHRLDEYLQGTIFSVSKDRLNADLTLTPGVAVFPVLIRDIDTNADGTISEAEQHAYAERVLGDLALAIDGQRLTPHLTSVEFGELGDMKGGLGEIHLQFYADLPRGGASRKLVFENRHESKISVYQVNVLVSRDPEIRIVGQNRNYTQAHYELDFEQGRVSSAASVLIAHPPVELGVILLVAIALAVLAWGLRRAPFHTVKGS